jgi:methyltransferase (TIGR00027 family)
MSKVTISDREKAEQIQRTADVVSQIRYLEGKKGNPLINDPFAYLFVSPEGERMLDKGLQQWPFFAEYLIVREKFFDDQLNIFFKENNSNQLIILGAGNDMRAERLPFLKNKKIFEVDLPDKINLKKSILDEALGKLPMHVAYIAADVSTQGFMGLLNRQGFNPAESKAFILQGLIYYLSPVGVDSLFAELKNVFMPGDILLLDHVSKDLSPTPPYPSDPLEFLLSIGLSIKESALLGNMTARYFGKTYKEKWWVIIADKQNQQI